MRIHVALLIAAVILGCQDAKPKPEPNKPPEKAAASMQPAPKPAEAKANPSPADEAFDRMNKPFEAAQAEFRLMPAEDKLRAQSVSEKFRKRGVDGFDDDDRAFIEKYPAYRALLFDPLGNPPPK